MGPLSRRWWAVVVLVPLAWFLAALASGSGAAAADVGSPPAQTVPADNAVLPTAPPQLIIRSGSARATASGTATVLDTNGKTIAGGALTAGSDGALALPLPTLKPGIYTVRWRVADQTATFAFDVTGGAASPDTLVQPAPETTLGPAKDNVVEWVPLIAVMIFTGALALRLLVTAPAARRSGDDVLVARTDLRLTRLAAVAVTVFVPTTLLQNAYADGSFDFGGLWTALGADGDGYVLAARFVLTIIAALILIPLAVRRSRPPGRLLVVALGAGLLELALREVPTSAPANWPRTIFNDVLYIFHLWGAAVWIGGLAGLLLIALPRCVPVDRRRAFWPPAVRRFSATAMGSVAAIVLSGLWLTWAHVGSWGQFVHTLYGRTLLVKLIVVAVLVTLGAVNQFWLMPRLDAWQATGRDAAINGAVARDFRLTIALEVALGLFVLFLAPLLSGSARNQAFQAGPAALAQTASAGSTEVQLIPSALQPGLVDYRVQLHGATDPRAVSLTFAAPSLDLPARTVTATRISRQTYLVTGYYAPVVGDWTVDVRLDQGPAAAFALPVSQDPAELPRVLPPDVRWTTWVAGGAETLLVIVVLFTSFRVSRRITKVRTERARLTPPPVESAQAAELVSADR